MVQRDDATLNFLCEFISQSKLTRFLLEAVNTGLTMLFPGNLSVELQSDAFSPRKHLSVADHLRRVRSMCDSGEGEGDEDDDDEWEDTDDEGDFDSEGGLSGDEGPGGPREFLFMDEETKSRFTEYSLSSSVMRRNEQLTLLDDRFEKVSAAASVSLRCP